MFNFKTDTHNWRLFPLL